MRNQVRVASANDTEEVVKRADASACTCHSRDTGMLPVWAPSGYERRVDTCAAYVNAIPQFHTRERRS